MPNTYDDDCRLEDGRRGADRRPEELDREILRR